MRWGISFGLFLLLVLTGCGRPEQRLPIPTAAPIEDTVVVLTLALPPTGPQLDELESELLNVMQQIRRADKNWEQALSALQNAQEILSQSQEAILIETPAPARPRTQRTLQDLALTLSVLQSQLQQRDFPQARRIWQQGLWELNTLQLAILTTGTWHFVEFHTLQGSFVVLLDSFNAPLSTKEFLQAVQTNAFVGQPLNLNTQGNVIVLPRQGPVRPLKREIRSKGERQIRYNPPSTVVPVLTFDPPGAVALDEKGDFFIYFLDRAPAGATVLDGRYTVLGYIVGGLKVISKLRPQDRVQKVQPLTCTRPLIDRTGVRCLPTGNDPDQTVP